MNYLNSLCVGVGIFYDHVHVVNTRADGGTDLACRRIRKRVFHAGIIGLSDEILYIEAHDIFKIFAAVMRSEDLFGVEGYFFFIFKFLSKNFIFNSILFNFFIFKSFLIGVLKYEL